MAPIQSNRGFIRSHQNQFSTLYRLLDVVIILIVSKFIGFYFQFDNSATSFVFLFSALIFMLASESLDLYRSWRFSSHREILLTVSQSWLAVVIITMMVIFYLEIGEEVRRKAFATWAIVNWAALCFWRLCYRNILFMLRIRGANSRTAAIVGLTESGLALAKEINENPHQGIRLLWIFDDREAGRFKPDERSYLGGTVEDAIELARRNAIDLLYVAMPMKAEHRIIEVVERCGDTTADVHVIVDLFIYRVLNARWHSVGSVQTLSVTESTMVGFSIWLKRLEDLILGTLILFLIAVPMLFIGIGVKLTSKGPVFFKQLRYGMDGEAIRVWKFRSMSVMDNGEVIKQATKGDTRITPFGAFLRKTSLDELPQFFNVIQGSMSIVGPRPHAVAHNEQYRKLIQGYMLRHKVKPGITGWAQINGWRGETDTLDKMRKRIEFDLAYISNWSLWLDIRIVIVTVFKGFRDNNAY